MSKSSSPNADIGSQGSRAHTTTVLVCGEAPSDKIGKPELPHTSLDLKTATDCELVAQTQARTHRQEAQANTMVAQLSHGTRHVWPCNHHEHPEVPEPKENTPDHQLWLQPFPLHDCRKPTAPSPRLPACLPPQPVPHRLSCPQPSLPASALPTRYCLLLSRAISCPDLNNFLLCHPHSSAPSQLKRCWSPFTPFEKETGKEEKGYRKLAGERVGTGTGRGGVVGGVGLGGVEAEAKGKVE